jgi:hypothetical protein
MKKSIIVPLFAMLVGCGVLNPSSNSVINSLSSVDNSTSSISSSNSSTASSDSSSSSSTNSSSSSSSSSDSSGSSSSSTSSETPINNRRVPFNQIQTLVAQVVDAKAMGVINSKDRPPLNGRRNSQLSDQNYMVKVTETYNPNTQVTEDQTIKVTFNRVTNTETTELQTGTDVYLATAEPLIVNREVNLPGNIIITNVVGYEFRLLSGETVIEDWMSSEAETIEFVFEETLADLVVESRSLNASISFISFDGFTYSINIDQTVIFENLIDNDLTDENEAVGVISLSGLIEGLNYEVTYSGYKVIETITQDEVDGQVDKLYVLHQYTFISFVPLNLNQRPQDNFLLMDYDGVPIYDKTGYFSDSTRQSFVINNNTGLIYKIENITIESLSGGCVSVKNSVFPYDIKINIDGELEFYSIYQNNTILNWSCIKDKNGYKYVMNDKVNTFDTTTNTFFYVPHGANANSSKFRYAPTSNGLVMKFNNDYYWRGTVMDGQVERSLNREDNFKVFSNLTFGKNVPTYYIDYFTVKSGVLLSASEYKDWGDGIKYFFSYDGVIDLARVIAIGGSSLSSFNIKLIVEYDILLYYSNNQIVSVSSFSNKVNDFFDFYNDGIYDFSSDGGWIRDYSDNRRWAEIRQIDHYSIFDPKIIITNASLDGNLVVTFELSGNVYYDLVPEFIDGVWVTKPYITGTYVAPPTTSITLQPINK